VNSLLDIGVVGCGTAGAAAALFLARAGHRVTVYERVPAPEPVGAGIVLQPTGQHVLAELGLLAPILAKGARLDGLVVATTEGRTVVDLDYAMVDERYFGLGLHRGVLFQALYDAVRADPRIALRVGVAIEDLGRAPRDRLYGLESDGVTGYGPHDLFVVADGARSHLRDDDRRKGRRSTYSSATATHKTVRSYPWGALWFVAKDPEARFTKKLRQTVRGTRVMLGFLPTGLGPDDADVAPRVSLYWSLRCDAYAAWRAAGLAPWKDEVLRARPDAEPVLAQIEDPDQVLLASYHDVVMRRWHTHNVVYLGDAAHAMSPQLGQGCNLALWDAMTLAGCLESANSLPVALAAYSAEREDRLGFYQFATRWLTPFFQSDLPLLGFLRDHGMGLMTKHGPFQREMVRTMCGVKLGIVWGALDVARSKT
jgi:2-polyprenyl-6-methoxyphenol hydroxylase-like FAD-dependent oxidoreductase